MGVSFGLTQDLFNFWSKLNMIPIYNRQSANDITGEHTCVMIKAYSKSAAALQTIPNANWLDTFATDFKKRFLSLLSYEFSSFPAILALSVANGGNAHAGAAVESNKISFVDEDNNDNDKDNESSSSSSSSSSNNKGFITFDQVKSVIDEYDLRRLESYAKNMVRSHRE